jgi:hypothetical protein
MGDISLPVRVPTVVEDDMDFTVVSSNPAQMEAAQRSLILWCARKIEHVKQALVDVQEQHEIAVNAGWKADAWERQIRRAERRIDFYRKIKTALEAGYYIVPPFPIEIFAIRTNRKTPDPKRGSREWGNEQAQEPRILPAGEGDYVARDPEVFYRDLPGPPDKASGNPTTIKEYFAKHFLPVDFPFKLAKPAVLSETARAMALKVFDQMGVLPGTARTADPIVCGQILYPERAGLPRKAVTFFVAWWLDTRTL